MTWLLSNNRLEKVPFVSVLHTSSNRSLLSNQDKGCTPSVAHSLPLPLGPALLNLWTVSLCMQLEGGNIQYSTHKVYKLEEDVGQTTLGNYIFIITPAPWSSNKSTMCVYAPRVSCLVARQLKILTDLL